MSSRQNRTSAGGGRKRGHVTNKRIVWSTNYQLKSRNVYSVSQSVTSSSRGSSVFIALTWVVPHVDPLVHRLAWRFWWATVCIDSNSITSFQITRNWRKVSSNVKSIESASIEDELIPMNRMRCSKQMIMQSIGVRLPGMIWLPARSWCELQLTYSSNQLVIIFRNAMWW